MAHVNYQTMLIAQKEIKAVQKPRILRLYRDLRKHISVFCSETNRWDP